MIPIRLLKAVGSLLLQSFPREALHKQEELRHKEVVGRADAEVR
jgi:hypothetical protein